MPVYIDQSRFDISLSNYIGVVLNDNGVIVDGYKFLNNKLNLTYDPNSSLNLLVYRRITIDSYQGFPPGNVVDLTSLTSVNGDVVQVHPKGLLVIAAWSEGVQDARFCITGAIANGYTGWNLGSNRYYATATWPVILISWQGTPPSATNRLIGFDNEGTTIPRKVTFITWGD